MFISDARDVLIEAQDQLIDLLVQHDEATRAEDWGRVGMLKTEIANATVHQEKIRNVISSPAPRPAEYQTTPPQPAQSSDDWS